MRSLSLLWSASDRKCRLHTFVHVCHRTFQECEVKNMELRGDLYEKMVSLDASEPTPEENEQKAITKLRYMQVCCVDLLTRMHSE